MYTITYSPEAEKGLAKLKRNEPEAFKKAVKLLNEIIVHPKTRSGPSGTSGKGNLRILCGTRQITKKHRLVYRIFETEVHVDVLSTYGHYGDK